MINKKLFFLVLLLILIGSTNTSFGQGLSVSYLIPKNGLLSAPVSPFSIRGVRLPFSKFAGLQTGGTLYIFPGLPMDGLPFVSNESLRGPSFGALVPLEIYLGFNANGFQTIFSGGVFGLGLINNRVNQGKWDEAYANFKNWELANGNLSMENNLGWGWVGGLSFEIPVTRQYALSIGINYLYGHAKSPVSGLFRGYTDSSGLINEDVSFDNAKTSLQGLEISLGVSL